MILLWMHFQGDVSSCLIFRKGRESQVFPLCLILVARTHDTYQHSVRVFPSNGHELLFLFFDSMMRLATRHEKIEGGR